MEEDCVPRAMSNRKRNTTLRIRHVWMAGRMVANLHLRPSMSSYKSTAWYTEEGEGQKETGTEAERENHESRRWIIGKESAIKSEDLRWKTKLSRSDLIFWFEKSRGKKAIYVIETSEKIILNGSTWSYLSMFKSWFNLLRTLVHTSVQSPHAHARATRAFHLSP